MKFFIPFRPNEISLFCAEREFRNKSNYDFLFPFILVGRSFACYLHLKSILQAPGAVLQSSSEAPSDPQETNLIIIEIIMIFMMI